MRGGRKIKMLIFGGKEHIVMYHDWLLFAFSEEERFVCISFVSDNTDVVFCFVLFSLFIVGVGSENSCS